MKRKFTTFLIILILLLAAVSVWYYQKNIYSKEVLKLEILGPTEIELAQEVEYIVKYKNNGNIRLEEAKLIFEYPKNSVSVSGARGESSLRQEVEVQDIYPGEENTLHFKARLLGKEGEAKITKAWLSYQPKNLSARYESATTFTTLIKNAPLTFEFDLPSRVDSGKENVFRLNYFSNLNYPLSDLRIKIEYPAGFEFRESQPKALGNNEWAIPLLNKTEGGRIAINGALSGEVGETKIFRASLGVWQEGEFILLKEVTRGVEIARPSIFISLEINDSPQYVANPGEYLHYEIFFKNTGEAVLENLFLVVQLEKDLFDFGTLQPGSGQAQKEAGSIVWDHTVLPQLRFLPAMEEGKVEFWIKLKSDLPQNPVIRTKISLSSAQEEFSNKIATQLALFQKGLFSQGPFQNSGPLPPKVGETTTYTISWQVKNSSSDVRNLKARAVLPAQVRLTGELSPREARFAFDQASREIVWEVGDLGAGAMSPEIFFQIALIPDASQRGQAAVLLAPASITGEDVWANQTVGSTTSAINTSSLEDPSISTEMGIVQ